MHKHDKIWPHMNLIIDCNQASRLPTDRGKTRSHSLIVSPAVLAEIFLRTDPNPTLNRIRHYHFTIGLEIADVIFELSRLSSEEISSFQPFYSQRNTYQEDYEGLIEGIYKPTLDHVNWANGIYSSILHPLWLNCGRAIASDHL